MTVLERNSIDTCVNVPSVCYTRKRSRILHVFDVYV